MQWESFKFADYAISTQTNNIFVSCHFVAHLIVKSFRRETFWLDLVWKRVLSSAVSSYIL